MIHDEQDRRWIVLRGGANFRDMGGYLAAHGCRVRWGVVFRSGSTHRLDAADVERLRELKIRTLVDLRSTRERAQYPHGLAAQPDTDYWYSDHDHRSGNLSLMIKDISLGADRIDTELLDLYRELPYEFKDIYRTLFTRLACGPLPLLFNCAAGKDRTGVAAALILDALGVSWDDIMTDYMLSARSTLDVMELFGWSEERLHSGHYSPSAVTTLFGVKAAYLEAMKNSVLERSGSFGNFISTELGLNSQVLEELRARLLVRSASVS